MSALLLIGFALSLNAQVKLGVKGGVTLANFNEDPFAQIASEHDMKLMRGFDVAIFSTIEAGKYFAVQPELHYVQKGVRITGSSTVTDINSKMTYKYDFIELPVLARVNLMDPGEKVIFNVFAGPSVGYALSGKFKGENFSNEGGVIPGEFESDIEWDNEYGTDGVKDNRWDVGVVGGVGAEFLAGPVNILLDARYSMDFWDAVKFEDAAPDDHEKILNRGFSFTAGLTIPLSVQ